MHIHTITMCTLLILSSIVYGMEDKQPEQKRATIASSADDALGEQLIIKNLYLTARRHIIDRDEDRIRSLFGTNQNQKIIQKVFLYQGDRGDQGTLLHVAAQYPSDSIFSELFLRGAGSALNIQNSNRETPLMVLMRRPESWDDDYCANTNAVVQQLLESKADPNGLYADGSTPLITVLKRDDIFRKDYLVRHLLDARAHVHPTDKEGHNALHYAQHEEKQLRQDADRYYGMLQWLYKPSIENAQSIVALLKTASHSVV